MTRRPAPRPDPSRRSLSERLRVVAVTPPRMEVATMADRVAAAVDGGATAVMVRFPELDRDELVQRGKIVAALSRELDFYFILNGPPEAALAAGADAVHLGTRTVTPGVARVVVGQSIDVGFSVHFPFGDHLDEIASCSYISYSPVFATTSKIGAAPIGTEEFMRAVRQLALPVVALGGIDGPAAAELSQAGCRCVAAISAILGQDDPAEGAARIVSALRLDRAQY